jgi:hypothetical protein
MPERPDGQRRSASLSGDAGSIQSARGSCESPKPVSWRTARLSSLGAIQKRRLKRRGVPFEIVDIQVPCVSNNFDIIGDVHGQYDKLVALLEHLGYCKYRLPQGRSPNSPAEEEVQMKNPY